MIVPFILLTLVSYYMDANSLKCRVEDTRIEILRYLHHIISMYAYLGSLFFGHYEFHLLFMLSVWAGWKLKKYYENDQHCFLTRFVNKLCGFRYKEKFHDLNWFFLTSKTHYIVFLFDIFMILKTRNLLG